MTEDYFNEVEPVPERPRVRPIETRAFPGTCLKDSPPHFRLDRDATHLFNGYSDFERSSFDTLFQRYFNTKPGLLPVQRRQMSVYVTEPRLLTRSFLEALQF